MTEKRERIGEGEEEKVREEEVKEAGMGGRNRNEVRKWSS